MSTKMYLRKVSTHGGSKLWFYSARDWQCGKFLGEFTSIEEAVNTTGRSYCGLVNSIY